MSSSSADTGTTIALRPWEIVHQVGFLLENKTPDRQIRIPESTTAQFAIQAALPDYELRLRLLPAHLAGPKYREAVRDSARRSIADFRSSGTILAERPTNTRIGLPIRTHTQDLPILKPPSRETKQKLMQKLRENPDLYKSDPAVVVLKPLDYGKIPLIRGSVFLQDSETVGPDGLDIGITDMIWDTGANRCMLSRELVGDDFYQKCHEANPLTDDASVVAAVGTIRMLLSNTALALSVTIFIGPSLPNAFQGVLLGQHSFLDRLVAKQVPRSIIVRRGQQIQDDCYGDILLYEYLDQDDRLVSADE